MMKRSRIESLFLLALVVALCLIFTPTPANSAEKTLTIGLASPLSGRGADWGPYAKRGRFVSC